MTDLYNKKLHCSRCKGTGFRSCARAHLGVPGLCFDCNGSGAKADQQAARAAAKARKEVERIEQEARVKIYQVRDANGGPKTPPVGFKRIWDTFRDVRGFSTQAYADAFGITKQEAWVHLCCFTRVYPWVADGKVVGWTLEC